MPRYDEWHVQGTKGNVAGSYTVRRRSDVRPCARTGAGGRCVRSIECCSLPSCAEIIWETLSALSHVYCTAARDARITELFILTEWMRGTFNELGGPGARRTGLNWGKLPCTDEAQSKSPVVLIRIEETLQTMKSACGSASEGRSS